MRELTYNNSKKSMISTDYSKSSSNQRSSAILAALIGSLAAFNIGSCIGWSSNAIDILLSDTFPLSFENMTTQQIAWAISIFTLGATISPLVVFKLWRFLGSKLLILIGSGFLITSWILLTFYLNAITVICARLLAGLGSGCLHFLMPIYIQDLTSSDLRHIIDYVWHSHLAAGIFIQFITGLLDNIQWVSVLSAIAPFLLFVGFLFMPESPRYLCATGNSNTAKDILKKFRELNEDVEQEIYIWSNKKADYKLFKNTLKSSSNLRRLLPTIGLVIFEQLTGLWAAFFYLSWIFRISGGNYSPDVTVIVIAGIYFLSIFVPKLCGINFNDKTTLICSSILKALTLIILGFYIHYQGVYGHLEDYEYVPLTCYGIFVSLNGMGLNRITWKYTRILVPKSHYFNIKAIFTSINWSLLVLFTRIYPRLIELVGIGWLFWFMALSCIMLAIFSSVLIPDLKSLETKYIFDEDDISHNDIEQQSSSASSSTGA